MQQPPRLARHDAVGVEEILLQPQPGELALQVAVAIIRDAMAQDQVLRAGRRADRIGLDEAERRHRAPERCRCAERGGDGHAAEPCLGQGLRHGASP